MNGVNVKMSPKKRKTVLIDYADIKSINWMHAARENDMGNIVPQGRSPILTFLILVKRLVLGAPVDAICMRYLNDNPQRWKTVLRLISECFTVALCKIFRIRLLWICHNIDRETVQYFPKLAKFRRRMVAISSNSVFVTDGLLKPKAAQALNISPNKIKSVSFGRPSPHRENSRPVAEIRRATDWCHAYKRHSPGAKIGLWIGDVSPKKLGGLKEIETIVNAARKSGNRIGFVVIGNIREALNDADPSTLGFLCSSPDVCLIPDPIKVPPHLWPSFADFLWKPLGDISIPLTAYNACDSHLPICCMPRTFLAEFVYHYEIGFAIDVAQVSSFFHDLGAWRPNACDAFLASHSWENGAAAILAACDDEA